MRRTLAAITVLGATTALSGCGSEEPSEPGTSSATAFVLRITNTTDDETVKVDGVVGTSVELTASTPATTLTIESVDGETVEISTDPAMAPPGETGGINLNDPTTDFSLRRNEPAIFSTPTTGETTTFTVAWEEKYPVE